MATNYIQVPIHIAINTKFISRCRDNLFECFCQFMDLFSSKASLIIPFQIQPDRILQFSPVQNFHDLLGFALYLCNCHSIGILICPNRDIVFPAFREVLLKVAIYHVSRFCNPQDCEPHAVISNCFPVNFPLPGRYINSSYFHVRLLS